MSEPEPEFHCGACRSRLHVQRIPVPNAGSTTVDYINGTIRCLTPGCLCDKGAVDRNRKSVDV